MIINNLNNIAMKTSKLLTASLFVLGILFSGNILAQSFTHNSTQVVRNTSPITYSANNPDGTSAIFTWEVSGGTIVVGGVDQTSPYIQNGTAAATVSIQVRWNSTNTTSANTGTLTVSKTVGALSCPSADHVVNVQSWVAPSASVTSTAFTVCSGDASSINLAFQGNAGAAGYLYRWRVVRVSDNAVVEDHTAANSSSATATASVAIAGITNATAAPVQYRFELTQMQDAFSDMNGTITAGSLVFTVNPVPTIGTINSSANLILR